MQNFNIKKVMLFLIQSVVAGLAIAFILVNFLPGLLPSGLQRDFSNQNINIGPPGSATASYHSAVAVSAPAVANRSC